MSISQRKPLFLTLIALGLAFTGWSLVQSAHTVPQGERFLVHGLEGRINDLSEVIIERGTESVVLRQQNDKRWTLPEHSDYPVDLGRLRGFLLELSKARLIEEKTAREDNHPTLNLDDLRAVQVTLSMPEGVFSEVMLGKPAERRAATYVRYPHEKQTWLANGRLQPGTDFKQWVRQEVLHLSEPRVQQITIMHGGKNSLVVTRDAPQDRFSVRPAPKQVDRGVEYQLTTMPRLFTHLSLTDVMAASELRSSSNDVSTVETFDGLMVRMRFNGEAADESDRWVTLEAEASAGASAEVKKEAEDINARSKDWAYRFPPFVMNQMRLTMDALSNYRGPLPMD
jgi:hypothetical protein